MVRQCHEDLEQLRELWNNLIVALGKVQDEEFAASLTHVTILVNSSDRAPEDLRSSLEYMKAHKINNSFIKTVTLVCHKLVEVSAQVLAVKHEHSAKRLQSEPALDSIQVNHVDHVAITAT